MACEGAALAARHRVTAEYSRRALAQWSRASREARRRRAVGAAAAPAAWEGAAWRQREVASTRMIRAR